VDIRLDEILPDKNFVGKQIVFTEIRHITTFGGAYAVLAYIAQAGVEQYVWLTGSQMMDGLGLAETTPGPLIMVVQFIFHGHAIFRFEHHDRNPRGWGCRAIERLWNPLEYFCKRTVLLI